MFFWLRVFVGSALLHYTACTTVVHVRIIALCMARVDIREKSLNNHWLTHSSATRAVVRDHVTAAIHYSEG